MESENYKTGLKPGVTQREIFRMVSKDGGTAKETHIRKHLQDELGITSVRGVKKHLKTMTEMGLFLKKEDPGGTNIWSLYEDSDECFEYLSDLIWRATLDKSIAEDIERLFLSRTDVIETMVWAHTHRFTIYLSNRLSDILQGGTIPEPDLDTLKIYQDIARYSPTLFSLGAQSQRKNENRLFMGMITDLLHPYRIKLSKGGRRAFMWHIAAAAITASIAIDHAVFSPDLTFMSLTGSERTIYYDSYEPAVLYVQILKRKV